MPFQVYTEFIVHTQFDAQKMFLHLFAENDSKKMCTSVSKKICVLLF